MINQYMTLLVEELAGEGIPDPLGEAFTLAAVWDDLARLAGERPPGAVRRVYASTVSRTDEAPAAVRPGQRADALDNPHARIAAGRA